MYEYLISFISLTFTLMFFLKTWNSVAKKEAKLSTGEFYKEGKKKGKGREGSGTDVESQLIRSEAGGL